MNLFKRKINIKINFEIILISFLFISIINPFLNYSNLILSALAILRCTIILLFILNKLYTVNKKMLILYLTFIASLLVSYVTHFSGLEVICNLITLSGVLVCFKSISSEKKYRNLIFKIYSIFISIYLFCYFFINEYHGHGNFLNISINPNTATFIILIYITMLLHKLSMSNKKSLYITIISILLLIAPLLGSRTGMVGIFILLILYLFRRDFKSIVHHDIAFIIIFISFTSIVFTYLYSTTLYNYLGSSGIELFGKNLFTGRQLIWGEAYKQLNDNFIFGIGNNLAPYPNKPLETSVNIHNFILGVVTQYGIISLTLLLAIIHQFFKKYKKDMSYVFKIFWMTCMVTSFFEVQLYVSATMSSFILVMLMISFKQSDVEKRSDSL